MFPIQKEILQSLLTQEKTHIPVGAGKIEIIREYDRICLSQQIIMNVITKISLIKKAYNEKKISCFLIKELQSNNFIYPDILVIDSTGMSDRNFAKINNIISSMKESQIKIIYSI